MPGPTRCPWVNLRNPIYVKYHEEEWSVPCYDDRALYELLILECFQAGLSWECVLNKRGNFRRAYDGFDAGKVAAYGEDKIAELLSDPGLIRNRHDDRLLSAGHRRPCGAHGRLFLPKATPQSLL